MQKHVTRQKARATLRGETRLHASWPRLVAPVAFEIKAITEMRDEIFGPVLHLVCWGGEVMHVVR